MEPYIGEIRMFGGDYAPRDWAVCDGSMLSVSDNPELFSLIGATYGGDGRQTFALPDLRGRVPVHQGTDSIHGVDYPLGQSAGSERVTLTADQLPSHSHAVHCNSSPQEGGSPQSAYWANSATPLYSDSTPDAQMGSQAISATGGDQSHDNMMPYLTLNFIIALRGVYPQRG